MSLIQEALNRAQSKSAALAGSAQLDPKIQEQFPSTQGLEAFDQDLEKRILNSRRILPPEVPAKKRPVFLYAPLALLLLAGAYYWIQAHPEVEEVPPPVVSIEREQIPPKKITITEVQAPVAVPQIPVVQKKVVAKPRRATETKALFFLSGIAGGGAEPYAVVNGQILRVGEMVDEKALLESIGSDHVILNHRGETLRLKLKR